MEMSLYLFLVSREIPGPISQAHEDKDDLGCVSVFSMVVKMSLSQSKLDGKIYNFLLLLERSS